MTAPVPGLEQYVEIEPRRRIAVGEGTCIVCQRTRAAERRAALFRVCCYVGIVFGAGVLVGAWLTR